MSRRANKQQDSCTYVGIDVSRHQDTINWDMVECDTCVKFVYVKATEGATLTDPFYHRNMQGAQRHNIKVGCYHYFSTKSTIAAQFNNFSRRFKQYHQDLIPMIDVEDRGTWERSQLIDSVKAMADMIESELKVKPMIYSTPQFYNANLAPQFNSYPLYIGRYSTSKPQLKWGAKFTVWQYSDHGIITGINRYVDLCVFRNGKSLEDISI